MGFSVSQEKEQGDGLTQLMIPLGIILDVLREFPPPLQALINLTGCVCF